MGILAARAAGTESRQQERPCTNAGSGRAPAVPGQRPALLCYWDRRLHRDLLPVNSTFLSSDTKLKKHTSFV